MADFYGKMQGVATGLLTKFKQGTVTLTRTTYAAKVNDWDPPVVPVDTVYTLNAAVREVSRKYIDGTNILRSDGQINFAVKATDASGSLVDITPVKTDKISIDGDDVTILDLIRVPRAGTAVAFILIYRG